MTSDSGQEDWRDVQWAFPVEESVRGGVEKVDVGGGRQPSTLWPGTAADSQTLPTASFRVWRLPCVPSSVALLRRRLRAFLDDAGRSREEVEDLVLATSEAATNAVEHAHDSTEPCFDVAARIIDDVVTIVVTDHGQWRAPTASPHRGRGLAMMRVLADTTVAIGRDGTTVTLRNHRGLAEPLAEGPRAGVVGPGRGTASGQVPADTVAHP